METLSACTLDCQDTCSTIARTDLKNGKETITIKGNPDHPFTRGVICRKGRNAHQRLKSPERITTPLLKQNGVFHPVSWDAALDLTAKKIEPLRSNPAAMLHVRSYGFRGPLSNGSKYLFNALGASTTRGALCDDAGCTAYMEDFGALEMNDPMELLHADHIINWGKDLSRSSIHLMDLIKQARRRGCCITTVSPGGDGNDKISDRMIRVRPGRDRFLAAAIIKVILERNLEDANAVSQAQNFHSFREMVTAPSLKTLLKACDCSTEDLEYLVDVLTKRKKIDPSPPAVPSMPQGNERAAVAILMGWGIQRYRFGGETVRYLNALSFLSGHVGQSGGGTYFNISSGRNLNSNWVSAAGSPARALLLPRIGQEILHADPPIEFLLTDGSNFVNQAPDAATTMEAMKKIPFKVVIDAFMTDTASRADLILPCALDYEREEIVGSCLHNYVNYGAQVFPPSGSARCDFDIMTDLASRLKIPFPTKEAILEKSLNSPPLSHLGKSSQLMKRMREKGFVKASHPAVAWKDLQFAHPDGKYRLPTRLTLEPDCPISGTSQQSHGGSPDRYGTSQHAHGNATADTSGIDSESPEYPMHLLSLVNRDFMHSQIPETKQDERLNVWINPDSPHLKSLDITSPLYLATPLGRLPVKLNMMESLHPLALMVRRGGWLKYDRCVNALIAPEITDIGETAAYYSQCARLEND